MRAIVFGSLFLATIASTSACGTKTNKAADEQAPKGEDTNPADEAKALVNTYCAGCHSTARPAHHVILDTDEGIKQNAETAISEIEEKGMPPARASAQPTDEERTKMAEWLKTL